MFATPQKEHEWLRQLVGDWTYEGECFMGPDQPPMKNTGSESVRSLGGLWTIGEGKGEMPGSGTSYSVMTLGYDPVKKKYVGTFIASVMTHLWPYEGEVDATGKVLTLNSEGPSMAEADSSKMIPYQDVIEIVNEDYRVLRSFIPGPDGAWINFMTMHYKRVK
jgi:hypothetical protein